MSTIEQMWNKIDDSIDTARQAGVLRGLNASIQAMEDLKAEYIRMGQPMAAGVINTAIVKLMALTVDEVEG
jgi:hypothetical protein